MQSPKDKQELLAALSACQKRPQTNVVCQALAAKENAALSKALLRLQAQEGARPLPAELLPPLF